MGLERHSLSVRASPGHLWRAFAMESQGDTDVPRPQFVWRNVRVGATCSNSRVIVRIPQDRKGQTSPRRHPRPGDWRFV